MTVRLITLLFALAAIAFPHQPDGAEIYRKTCEQCDDSSVERAAVRSTAPDRSVLLERFT